MSKRSSRTTEWQYMSLLEFMRDHELFSRGKMTGIEGSRIRTQLWQELADKLNGDPLGPEKDAARWQKVWADWKCSARKKAAAVRSHRNLTGGGPPLATKERPTELDEALISFLGVEAVVGNESVPESGFPEASCSFVVVEEEIQMEEVFTPCRPAKRTLTSPAADADTEVSQASKAKKKKTSPATPALEPQLSAATLEEFANATTRNANAMEGVAVALLNIGDQLQSIARAVEAFLARQ